MNTLKEYGICLLYTSGMFAVGEDAYFGGTLYEGTVELLPGTSCQGDGAHVVIRHDEAVDVYKRQALSKAAASLTLGVPMCFMTVLLGWGTSISASSCLLYTSLPDTLGGPRAEVCHGAQGTPEKRDSGKPEC